MTISTEFAVPAEAVWALVRRSSTLPRITKGLLGFADVGRFPAEWEEGVRVETRLLFFGFIPGWRHRLTLFKLSDAERMLYTHENGGPVSSWDHLITVEEIDSRICRYTDDVKIDAGVFTPIIWLFAHILFRHRQRRLNGLLNATTAQYPHGVSGRQTDASDRTLDAGLAD